MCPERCEQRACTDSGECCHTQCLGSCTVPDSATACAACQHYFHEGRCVEHCPPGTYIFEGWRCITLEMCSEVHLLFSERFVIHAGECMMECPPGFNRENSQRYLRHDTSSIVMMTCSEARCPVVAFGLYTSGMKREASP